MSERFFPKPPKNGSHLTIGISLKGGYCINLESFPDKILKKKPEEFWTCGCSLACE